MRSTPPPGLAGSAAVERLQDAADEDAELALGRAGDGQDLLDPGRLERVGQAEVGHDREAEHLHAGVDRHEDLGDRRHPHHVGADGAEEAVLGAGLQVRPGDRHVDTAMRHDVLFQGHLEGRVCKSRSYGSIRSGNLGPSRSSLGPIRGLSPIRLMWSSMTTRSPLEKSGFSPPAALETITRRHPSSFMTRIGNVTCAAVYPS